jgi:hypothetical protein
MSFGLLPRLTRPILPGSLNSVNHMFPSGPRAMNCGLLAAVGIGTSLTFVPSSFSSMISGAAGLASTT